MSIRPSSLWNRLRSSRLRKGYERLPRSVKISYRFLTSYPSWLTWRLHPSGYRHTQALLDRLRSRYEGCSVVLLGNGPSLRGTDWSLLRQQLVIGTNRIYLLHQEMGFVPQFYVCVNHLILRQFSAEIEGIGALKLLDWQSGHRRIRPDPRTAFVPQIPSFRFHTDISRGWNVGYTVTFAALQLAFHLGFSRVILVGVDHRFVAQGPAMREIVSEGPDPDHFDPDYFGKGVRWELPNLDGSERFYRLAKRAFEDAEREIVDATEGGALGVFPKVDLADALAGGSHRPAQRG